MPKVIKPIKKSSLSSDDKLIDPLIDEGAIPEIELLRALENERAREDKDWDSLIARLDSGEEGADSSDQHSPASWNADDLFMAGSTDAIRRRSAMRAGKENLEHKEKKEAKAYRAGYMMKPLPSRNIDKNATQTHFREQNKKARNRVRATIKAGHEIPTSMSALVELESLRRQKFAFFLVLWLDKLLKDSNYSQEELKTRTVLEEAEEQRLVGEFRAAQAKLNLSSKDAYARFERLLGRAFGSPQPTSDNASGTELAPPDTAPALYRDRDDPDEKPETFIWREYAKWVEQPQGLPRKLLSDLDPPLYRAIYRHPLSEKLNAKLYKTAGRPRKNASASDLDVLERKRARDRATSKRHYAKKKL